jgi:hypothetical protein
MIGGTNGAHLTSFSLVDVLSHGRACGMLNPYWTVFFAPAIQQPLHMVGRIYRLHRRCQAEKRLGLAVAEAMIAFGSRRLPVWLARQLHTRPRPLRRRTRSSRASWRTCRSP